MTIRIKKQTLKMLDDWEKFRKETGLTMRDARILGKLKKMKLKGIRL